MCLDGPAVVNAGELFIRCEARPEDVPGLYFYWCPALRPSSLMRSFVNKRTQSLAAWSFATSGGLSKNLHNGVVKLLAGDIFCQEGDSTRFPHCFFHLLIIVHG